MLLSMSAESAFDMWVVSNKSCYYGNWIRESLKIVSICNCIYNKLQAGRLVCWLVSHELFEMTGICFE